MPLSAAELNRIADEVVANALTCYIHTGAPGADGTANRVAGVAGQAIAAADWSNASDGDVSYDEDVAFGVLSASNERVLTAYTLFRGNAYAGTGQLSATVPAGATYTIDSGTIRINGSTS